MCSIVDIAALDIGVLVSFSIIVLYEHMPRSGITGSCMHAHLLKLCPILCDPMDYSSPPGSSVHVLLQAKILEWVARPSSRGSFLLTD